MKRFLSQSSVFLVWVFLLTGTLLNAIELDWLHDYDAGLKQAKAEHKNVYLFIGADKCKFCKKYKALTLSDAQVMKTLRKDYVPVYLSRDQHFIPARFERMGAPIHYFLTPEGEIIYFNRGMLEIPGFYTMLDEVELSKDQEE